MWHRRNKSPKRSGVRYEKQLLEYGLCKPSTSELSTLITKGGGSVWADPNHHPSSDNTPCLNIYSSYPIQFLYSIYIHTEPKLVPRPWTATKQYLLMGVEIIVISDRRRNAVVRVRGFEKRDLSSALSPRVYLFSTENADILNELES